MRRCPHDDAERFLKLEAEAREAKRGLWAKPGAMNAPAQSVASLENQIAIIEKKIDDLSKKIDHILEIIRKLQLQPMSVPPATHHPEQEKTDEQVNVSSAEDPSDETVYVTKSGRKYHNLGCRYLKGQYSTIKIDGAKRSGLQPCSVCFPEKAE